MSLCNMLRVIRVLVPPIILLNYFVTFATAGFHHNEIETNSRARELLDSPHFVNYRMHFVGIQL